MSRILRRPMFRGGPVDSRGSGITSGLADGGQIGGGVIYGEPNSDGRYGFRKPRIFSMSGLKDFGRIFNPGSTTATSTTPTGGQILSQAQGNFQGPPRDPFTQAMEDRISKGARGTARNKLVQSGINRIGAFAGANPLTATAGLTALAFAPTAGLAYMNRPKTVEALEYMKSMNESGVFDETAGDDYTQYAETFKMLNETGTPLSESEVGLTSSKEDIEADRMDRDMAEFEEVTTEPGADRRPGESSLDALLRQGLETSKKTFEEEIKNNEEDPELTKEQLIKDIEKNKELYAELLGKDKAKREDIGGILEDLSIGFLSEGGLKEGFTRALMEQKKRGPSQQSKINTQAATVAINEYIQGKKSKAELDQVMGKIKFQTDYNILANKKSLADNIITASGKVSGKIQAIEAGIKATYDKVPTRVEKGGTVTLVEENVGEIFVKEDDGSVVYIYKDDEGNIKQKRLY